MKTLNNLKQKYHSLLQNKEVELAKALRDRARISVETSAEEFEQNSLRDQLELEVQAVDRETLLLREVRGALARCKAGTYGTCDDCDRQIPEKRLRAIPWARRCVACQDQADRQQAAAFRRFLFAA